VIDLFTYEINGCTIYHCDIKLESIIKVFVFSDETWIITTTVILMLSDFFFVVMYNVIVLQAAGMLKFISQLLVLCEKSLVAMVL
jgi:hypothetical protein